jgi:hypothetical protein
MAMTTWWFQILNFSGLCARDNDADDDVDTSRQIAATAERGNIWGEE